MEQAERTATVMGESDLGDTKISEKRDWNSERAEHWHQVKLLQQFRIPHLPLHDHSLQLIGLGVCGNCCCGLALLLELHHLEQFFKLFNPANSSRHTPLEAVSSRQCAHRVNTDSRFVVIVIIVHSCIQSASNLHIP